MKNNFLRKGLITGAVLTGWLVFTSLSGGAIAADVVVDGADATIDATSPTAAEVITFVTSNAASVDASASTTGALTVNEDITGTISGASTADLSVGSTVLTAGNTGTTTLVISNDGAVDLKDVAAGANTAITISDGAGAVTIDSVDLDAGAFTFTQNDAEEQIITLVTADTIGNTMTVAGTGTGATTLTTLAVAEDLALTVSKTGGAVTAGTTTIADTKTLTVAGDQAIGLGAVGSLGATTGITSTNIGAVSASTVALGAGTLTVTNSGTGSIALGTVTAGTASNALTIAGEGTGAVSATNLTVNQDLTLTATKAFSVGTATAIADEKTLTVAGAKAVALGAVTDSSGDGNATGITSTNSGAVSATSVALGAGTLTATNSGGGTLALGDITTTAETGKLTTAGGAVTADNMTISNNTTLTAGDAFTVGTATSIASTKTLTIAGTKDVALGNVSSGSVSTEVSALTGGDNNVSAGSVTLSAGQFKVTKGAGTVNLGEIKTGAATGADANDGLLTANGTINATNLNIDHNTTIRTGAGAGLTLSGTCTNATDIAESTALTVTAAADGLVTLKGTTIHDGGSLISKGGAISGDTLTVGANDTANITVTAATGKTAFTALSAGAGSTINITTGDADDAASAKLGLGNVTFAGGVTAVAATGAGTDDFAITIGNFTNTGDVSILKTSGTVASAKAYIADGSTIHLDKDVIYNGLEMTYDAAQVTQTGTGQFINAAGAAASTTDGNDQTVAASGVIDTTTAIASGKTLTVNNGATAVASKANTTIDAGAAIDISSGANYTQFGNNFAVSGDANLGGELLLTGGGVHSIASLNAVGTTGKIRGDDPVSVAAMDIASGEKIKVENTVNLTGADDFGAGTLELGNTDSNAAATLNLAGNATSVGTLGVTNAQYAVLTDGTGTNTLTLANGANIDGHLDITGGANLAVTSGAFKVSANTLNIGTGSTVTIGETAYIANSDTGGNSHFTVIANAGGANSAIIDNQSTQSCCNSIDWLEVKTTSNSNNAAQLEIRNSSSNSAYLTLNTVDVKSFAGNAANNAVLDFANGSAGTSNITINNLNIYDTADSTAQVRILSDGDDTDQFTLVKNLEFKSGDSGKFVDQITLESNAAVINNVVVNAVAADDDVTGEISVVSMVSSASNNINGNGNITGTVTLTGGGVNNRTATLNLTNAATNVTGTVVFVNDTANKRAVLDLGFAGTAIDNISVAANNLGHIDNSNNGNYYGASLAGTLVADNAVAVNGYSGYSFNIANTGKLDASTAGGVTIYEAGGNGGASVTDAKVYLDMGTTNNTAGQFAAVALGANDMIDRTTATATAGVDNVAGIVVSNGMSGVRYTDVITTTGQLEALDNTAFVEDDTLTAENQYRTYTLKANAVTATNFDVLVGTNTAGINSAVTSNGGTSTAAAAANFLVSNEASFDTAGRAYVQDMTNLSAPEFARAAEQTIGEEGTTATAQAGVMSVQNSAKSVSNQMTSFRSGNIGAAMTSSFNSGGATSALSNMADADTLADAYEAGFTSASDCGVYKKVQVWANGFGGFGEQGSDGNMIGYDFWNIGTMVGLDYAFAKELRVGALLGYSYNKTDGYWGSGDSSDNAIRFGAYASYNWDNFFVDMSPTMGVHMIDSNRNIWNGATAKGERTGVDFNMNGTIGYTFNLPAAIQITPTYSLSYTMFYDPDYTETGAGAANLAVDSFTSNSLIQDLGVKVGKLFRSSDKLAFLPEVWGGWEVEYLNTGGSRNSTTSSSIGGQAYSTTMNGMSTHRGYWGAGMTALIGDDVSVYGRYDHKIWDKGYNVGFSAGVKVSF